ncbi:hypothetical protein P3G55_11270 [Leptospira sp. 96542]|nr:hypothetical protein [Leptospira sp. 96542]
MKFPLKLKFLHTMFFLSVIILSFLTLNLLDLLYVKLASPAYHFSFPANIEFNFVNAQGIHKIKTNQLGLRGSLPKPEDCVDLILGDSQAFGIGLEEQSIFHNLISSTSGCEVYNASFPGYSIENELSLFRILATNLKLRKVVLFIYGNDVYETGYNKLFETYLQNNHLYLKFFRLIMPNVGISLAKLKFNQYLTDSIAYDIKKNEKRHLIPETKFIEDNSILLSLYNMDSMYFQKSLDTRKTSKNQFQKYKRYLEILIEEIKNENIELDIIYLPLDIEHDASRGEEYKQIGFILDKQWLEGDSAFVLDLYELTSLQSLRFIDLRHAMRQSKRILKFGDFHLNEKAHTLIAEKLIEQKVFK